MATANTNLKNLEIYVKDDFIKIYRLCLDSMLNNEYPFNKDKIGCSSKFERLIFKYEYDINYMIVEGNEHLCFRGEYRELFEKLNYQEICEIRLLIHKWEDEMGSDYLHHGGLPYDEDPEEFNYRLLDCYISMNGMELLKEL